MNFFEAQDRARRSTGWLVLLYGLAVVGLILVTNLLVLGVLAYLRTGGFVFDPELLWQQFSPDVFVGVALLVGTLILLGSSYKLLVLAKGGPAVAEMLGGRLVPRSSREPEERRLLNVVEEMAIAAGMPMPRVYLLEEAGINAFAAGLSPNNAVIAVTRGALQSLTRDELQGVIAHEFSHIFNGDMRLNLRLVGILHGILLLGLIGYYLLRVTRYLRSSRRQKGGNVVVAILALGAGLVAVGYIGFFFGQWIKSLISRQREYLADASAVRYTRNRDGIAGALKKIGGSQAGSLLESPAAPEYNHAYFAQGLSGFLQGLFATHPPLAVRIKRIDPGWDGKFITPHPVMPQAGSESGPGSGDAAADRFKTAMMGGAVVAGTMATTVEPDKVVDEAGQVGPQQVRLAQQILAQIPAALYAASEEPFGARAVIYGLLLDPRPAIRTGQLETLRQHADPAVADKTVALQGKFETLPEAARLPLTELAMPALEALSPDQYRQFRDVVQALIAADQVVSLREWIMQRFVLQQLDINFGLRKPPRGRYGLLGDVKPAAELLLSLLAWTEHADGEQARQAFQAGKSAIGAGAFKMVSRDAFSLAGLDQALDKLEALKPLLKARIIKACAACIMYDNRVSLKGMELFRTIGSCLEVPLPPLAVEAGRQ